MKTDLDYEIKFTEQNRAIPNELYNFIVEIHMSCSLLTKEVLYLRKYIDILIDEE